jgi:glutamate synthase (NADPH/NADH) small chain
MTERLPPKERIKIPRQDMPEQDAKERARNFGEVNLGFDAAIAQKEAQRCLECANPKCIHGCPVGVQVREVVSLVLDGEYLKAASKLREDNVLPAVTGRVCPQENQCEGACILGKRFAPLAIGHIERFVADYERKAGKVGLPRNAHATGKKVAIVGSGPAGLSCAGDLVQKGHEVTVLEALHEIGGVLLYGIPEF